MNTLNLNKIFFIIGLMFVSFLFASSAQAECATTGDKITTAANSGTPVDNQEGEGAGDQCNQTPDSYQLTFYKLGLCTADTSYNDLSSCQFIVNDADGVTHDITYPSVGTMDIPEFSIDPGTYPYLTVLLSNKLGIKHSFEATNNVKGHTGTGKFCWTDLAGPGTYNNAPAMTYTGHSLTSVAPGVATLNCGTSAGTAKYTYEIINVFNSANDNQCYTDGANATSGTSNFAANGDRTSMGTIVNGTATINLLKSDDTYATTCQNGAKILWTTLLTTPYVVTEDSTFGLMIKTVEGVSIDFNGSPASTTEVIKVGANPPQLYLTVTN